MLLPSSGSLHFQTSEYINTISWRAHDKACTPHPTSGSLIQIENRKTLWTVSTPACVSWVCVDGSSARKPGSHNLPVDSAVKGVFKRVNFWDTKILQLTRYRMSLSKILAHLRQSWYTLGDNNYYNVNNNNNNNSIKHLSRLFLSHGSRVMICIILDCFGALWSPAFHQLCCYEGSDSVHPLYICVFVSVLSVCFFVSMNVWSESGFFLDDRCWFTLRDGFGPRGRRFQCCQRFPWRSSVVLTLRALLPSNVSWLLAAVCPRPSPRSCPSPLTAWV